MKKILILLLLGLVQFVFASIGEVTQLSGNVSVQREGKSLAPKKGFKIEKKDTIYTLKNGRIKITFNDKTIISLGKNSSLSIAEYLYDETKKSAKAEFSVLKGAFKSITGRIGKINPARFKLKTKNATIGVRGTIFYGIISGDTEIISCSQGEIIVTTKKGSVIVKSGNKTKISADGTPSTPKKYDTTHKNNLEKLFIISYDSSKFSPKEVEVLKSIFSESKFGVFSPPSLSSEQYIGDDIFHTPFESRFIDGYSVTNVSTVSQVITDENSANQEITSSTTITPDLPPVLPPAGSTGTIQNSTYADSTIDYGYWMESDVAIDTYVTGVLSDPLVIDDYITTNQTATYTGSISALTGGVKASGNINLDMDFGAQSFTGTMNLQPTAGALWAADITNGSLNPNSFASSTISTATRSEALGISGTLDGNFFGTNVDSVGGTFDLSSTNEGTVSGVYGATKQ